MPPGWGGGEHSTFSLFRCGCAARISKVRGLRTEVAKGGSCESLVNRTELACGAAFRLRLYWGFERLKIHFFSEKGGGLVNWLLLEMWPFWTQGCSNGCELRDAMMRDCQRLWAAHPPPPVAGAWGRSIGTELLGDGERGHIDPLFPLSPIWGPLFRPSLRP